MQGTPCLTNAALGGKGVGVTGIKFLIFSLLLSFVSRQKKVEVSPRGGAQNKKQSRGKERKPHLVEETKRSQARERKYALQ